MKTTRCFLALRLELETVRAIADVQKQIMKCCIEKDVKVRWVPPPNMHVTMRFLGQITDPMVSAVKDMMERMALNTVPFELESLGIGAFPSTGKPKIVWAGVGQGEARLVAFQAEVSKRLVDAGFNFDDKPFRPHVTIGRVKDGAGRDLASCIEQHCETVLGMSTIRELICYRSDLTPKGAEYTGLWSLPFTSRAPAPRPQTEQETQETEVTNTPTGDNAEKEEVEGSENK